MSKAVTNEEVEDVLSSIRRLVSEDKRPLAGLRSAPSAPLDQEPEIAQEAPALDEVAAVDDTVEADVAQAEPDTAPADHFVLTPALRVAKPDTATAPEEDGDAPLDLASVARDTWEDDADEVDALSGADENTPLMLFPKGEEARTNGEDPAMDAVDALVQGALDADVHENEDSSDDYSDESYWDVDDAPQDTDEAQCDAGASMDTEDDPQETVDAEEAPEDDAISILPLTAKIAALEAAVGGINQEWEPDGSEDADMAAPDTPAMAWEDDVDLDANGAPMEETFADEVPEAPMAEDVVDEDAHEDSTVEPAPTGAALGGDDQLLDEDALRELVSDIVRSELQGALGERITRNVRKLVRREIHRALAAQDLE